MALRIKKNNQESSTPKAPLPHPKSPTLPFQTPLPLNHLQTNNTPPPLTPPPPTVRRPSPSNPPRMAAPPPPPRLPPIRRHDPLATFYFTTIFQRLFPLRPHPWLDLPLLQWLDPRHHVYGIDRGCNE